MAGRFTDRLRQAVDPIWEAQHRHPFITGIGDGSLDIERFKYWVRQDYLFLVEYARTLSMASARAPDLAAMTKLAELAHETLHTEMSLHRAYAKEFGISEAELEATEMSPTCQAYTDFLLRTASIGSFAEVTVALLPCMWGFCEIGQRLKANATATDQRYTAWIDMYSSDEFVELADWCRSLVDRLAAALPNDELRRVEAAFITSSRYEHAFWEMGWNQESWPV